MNWLYFEWGSLAVIAFASVANIVLLTRVVSAINHLRWVISETAMDIKERN